MATRKRPKRKKPTEKPDDELKIEVENAKPEAEAALAHTNDEEKTGSKMEAALVKAQEALAATQAEVEKERQARVEAERALAEAQGDLDAAQAEIEKEYQNRSETENTLSSLKEELTAAQSEVKQERQERKKAEQAKEEAERAMALRDAKSIPQTETATTEKFSTISGDEIGEQPVSFVIRVTVDEHWEPQRTEIQPAQSSKKKIFPALDGQQLAAFIKAYLVSLKPTVPTTTPPATAETPPAESSKRTVSLTISNVQVFRLGFPGVSAMTLHLNESFVVQTSFKLEGPEALALTAQESAYQIQIHAHDVTRGSTTSITTYRSNLVKDTLDYTAVTQASGLPPGIYRLVSLMTLEAPTTLIGHHEGPIFQVGEVQLATDIADSQEVIEPQ